MTALPTLLAVRPNSLHKYQHHRSSFISFAESLLLDVCPLKPHNSHAPPHPKAPSAVMNLIAPAFEQMSAFLACLRVRSGLYFLEVRVMQDLLVLRRAPTCEFRRNHSVSAKRTHRPDVDTSLVCTLPARADHSTSPPPPSLPPTTIP